MTPTYLLRLGTPLSFFFGRVNRGLGELSRWFRCNRLTLNLKKTEYVYFGRPGGRETPPGGLVIGGVEIRRVEGARFLGVWVDEGLRWTGHIEKVRAKVGQLLGVLGRAGSSLGGRSLLSLYNALVLPRLQYCLMAWGDFREGRNLTLGESLARYQKRCVRLIAGVGSRSHADPLLAEYGVLKVGDLYRQQLRVHAWRFWKGRLPPNQSAMLGRVGDVHRHATRSAVSGLFLSTRDHRSVGYRIPKEWATVSEVQRGVGSLGAFKRGSRAGFLAGYRAFRCGGCRVCGGV